VCLLFCWLDFTVVWNKQPLQVSDNKVGEQMTRLPLSGFNDNEIKSIFTGPVWAIAVVLMECFTLALEIRLLL